MEQQEINEWVEKQVSISDARKQIAVIIETAELQKKALADQIAQIDINKMAEINAINESIK